ncbi:MAG: hydroxymethylbilane synthase [Candidatus Hadarchaeales archaeon]
MKLRIGTRGSRLALIQTQTVIEKLKKVAPKIEVEIKIIKTSGDLKRKVPGMFVNEINRAVLNCEIDVGVHSLKDLPTNLPKKLEIACIPERKSPHDALVSRENLSLKELSKGAVIGTDSERRKSEISFIRPDLKFKEIHGNIETRVSKVDRGIYDGTVLALAALERLGLTNRASQVFRLDEVVPAPGQGALAVVKRKDDDLNFLEKINDNRAQKEVMAERIFLEELGSGCRDGAGAVARYHGNYITLIAVVHDGGRRLIKLKGSDPIELGRKAGRILWKGRST